MTETAATGLLDSVRRLDEAVGLFAPGDLVVVAVSGGPDSMALLAALSEYAPERELELHVGHLDHLLRPESSDDAAFVSGLAQKLALPCTLGARDVETLAAQRGRGLEDAARAARYEFLAEIAAGESAAAIAVAHTADDQAETVLLNLLRGSGLRGLKGMSPSSRLPSEGQKRHGPRLVRPLLDVTRADVMSYLNARELPHRFDESNLDLRFLRNRVRHEIIPLLETVNPAVRASLVRTARSIADDYALIEESVDAAWRERAAVRDVSGTRGREVDVGLAGWFDVHPAVQRRVLRRGVAALRGRRDLGWQHIESLRELLDDGAQGGLLTLPGGIQAVRRGDRLTMVLEPSRVPPPVGGGARLAITGETSFPGGWRFVCQVRDRRPDDDAATTDVWSVRIDAGFAHAHPQLRLRQPGDRLQPLGMGGRHKSLQDLFVDARVPHDERDAWPIVVAGDTVLWVPGVRMSHEARVTNATRRVLCVSAHPPGRVSGPA